MSDFYSGSIAPPDQDRLTEVVTSWLVRDTRDKAANLPPISAVRHLRELVAALNENCAFIDTLRAKLSAAATAADYWLRTYANAAAEDLLRMRLAQSRRIFAKFPDLVESESKRWSSALNGVGDCVHVAVRGDLLGPDLPPFGSTS